MSRIHLPLYDAMEAALSRVLRSGQYILGPELAAFEDELARYCGAAHAVGVSSGTDALLAALMALGVGPGDEVVTTPFTFIATAEVIERLGARAVFADIDPATFTLDPAAAVACITDATRAIIPVHLFGQCAEMGPLEQACRARDIALIEDAAQAIGAVDAAGRRAGSVGDFGCFSFFPAKNLGALGDAGGVTARDADLAERLRTIRQHGSKPKYFHGIIGGNFRLDALQAAILRVKLPWLDGWTEARRAAAATYRALFAERGLDGEVALPREAPGLHAYNQFVIRTARRDELARHLEQRGVSTAIYYPSPLHLQPCFAHLGYQAGDLPVAERACAEVLALPCFPGITEAEQARVVDAISERV
jgi:dTDP-4-amino-4,6-dideoxygalactose transaminase